MILTHKITIIILTVGGAACMTSLRYLLKNRIMRWLERALEGHYLKQSFDTLSLLEPFLIISAFSTINISKKSCFEDQR